jgi:hypothetical protein
MPFSKSCDPPHDGETPLGVKKVGILMRFTIGLLAVLCIANAVRSADPRAEEPGTLAQEYQKALKESGQVSPNFRDAKTDEERRSC